ncbi:hypothetical protein N7456_012882 [Penicillium angulare]|uniref:Uncharacterized protein n=1 Tax=Penicillium angulare TaxID=116970 RepID=A0A9W9EKM1_9EURO|nr:hypothetical protein N7456_012882 [Penicillium angulare]
MSRMKPSDPEPRTPVQEVLGVILGREEQKRDLPRKFTVLGPSGIRQPETWFYAPRFLAPRNEK